MTWYILQGIENLEARGQISVSAADDIGDRGTIFHLTYQRSYSACIVILPGDEPLYLAESIQFVGF